MRLDFHDQVCNGVYKGGDSTDAGIQEKQMHQLSFLVQEVKKVPFACDGTHTYIRHPNRWALDCKVPKLFPDGRQILLLGEPSFGVAEVP
jgi:hypothetical protein